MKMEMIAYEMQYIAKENKPSSITCIPFTEQYFEQYMRIYNECFHEMRKALEVKPYDFYSSFEQMKEKASETFLLLNDGIIQGAVTCLGNEIDDLIVNKKYQGKGYGKQLLHFAIEYMNEKERRPITLHVAAWNSKALEMYKKNGFTIIKQERIR